MRCYLAISLVISSATTRPDSVSARLGLEPTKTRLRGEPIRSGIYRKPEFDLNEWWMREEVQLSPENHVEDIQASFFNSFFEKLSGASSAIRELGQRDSVGLVIVYQMERIPYIGLSRSLIEKIASLGASVDFDIMADMPVGDSE